MDQRYRILVQSFRYFHANSHVMLSSALEGPALLLILRTYRLFNRRVWLAYDKAFCEHLAAVKVVNWSTMNIQLLYTIFVLLGHWYVTDSTFPLVRCQKCLERLCHRLSAGLGAEVYLPPNISCRFANRCSHCGGPH